MKIYDLDNIKAHMIRCSNTWPDARNELWGGNVVGDYDEDYVFDALYDVPNR